MSLVLAVGLVVARLASAPYDSAWLADILSSQIAQRARGSAVSIGIVRLDFTDTASAPLSFLDVSVVTENDDVVVSIPEVRISTPLDLLFRGEFRVGHVKAIRPEIHIERPQDGSALPSAADLAQTVDGLVGAAVADFATFGVEGIELEDAALDIEGPVERRFDTIDMTMTTGTAGKSLRIDASVAGRAGRWNVRFRHGAEADGQGRWFSLAASDVTAADFLPADYPVRAGRGLGLPLFPQATFHLDEDGAFKGGDMRLGVGAGYISLRDDEAIFIDEMLIALSWAPERPYVVLQPSYAAFGETRFAFHGEIRPPHEGQDTWQFAVEAPQARLKPRDVAGAPLVLDRVFAFGSFDAGRMLFDIDTFNLRAGPISVTAAGNIEFGPEGPLAAVAVSSDELTVASIKRIWPPMMVPEARQWFIKHAVSGHFDNTRLIVALDPLGFDGDPATVGWTPDGLRLDFSLDNGELNTIGELPKLFDMKATGEIRDGHFTMHLDRARAKIPGSGEIAVGRGLFTIPDLRPEEKSGQLELSLRGSAADIARLAELEPINGRTRLDVRPEGISGKADVTVSVSFPIRKPQEPVKPKEVSWTVAATLSDFSSDDPIAGQTIKNADLDVTANAAAAILRGRGVLNGLPVEIDLVQPLDDSEGDRNQGVVVDFDAGDLAERGIELGGLLDGKLRLNVETAEDGVRHVVANLTQTELHVPAIGWTKGAGVPAKAQFTAREHNGGQVIEDFQLTSDGVNVAGRLEIDRNGKLVEAKFDRFALRTSDSGRLTVTRDDGGYAIDLQAQAFDGRGIIANLKRSGGKPDGDLPDDAGLRFKARVDRLTGFNDAAVTNLALDMDIEKGRVARVDLTGLIDGRSDLSAGIASDERGGNLHLQAGDAGSLFRFLDIYERLRGGRARLDVSLPAAQSSQGRLLITDFSLAEDPALKQIVNSDPALLGGDSSPIARRRQMTRGNMSFQKMDVRFHMADRLLQIDSGAMRGPILGGSLEGAVNLGTQQVNLKGTFVPAYALNNLFGQIPVLGQLVGGRNGGLLGVTFRVTGTVETPIVTVNPISAIAPGIFRKIFE